MVRFSSWISECVGVRPGRQVDGVDQRQRLQQPVSGADSSVGVLPQHRYRDGVADEAEYAERQDDVDVCNHFVLDVGLGPAAGRQNGPHELRRMDGTVDDRLVRQLKQTADRQ